MATATGIRAAMCNTPTLARYAREHNGANVLALGATLVDALMAGEIVETWLSTPMREPRYIRRLLKIRRIEESDALDRVRPALDAGLGTLSTSERDALVLRVLEHLPYDQIAGLRQGRVLAARPARAIRTLRPRVTSSFGEDFAGRARKIRSHIFRSFERSGTYRCRPRASCAGPT